LLLAYKKFTPRKALFPMGGVKGATTQKEHTMVRRTKNSTPWLAFFGFFSGLGLGESVLFSFVFFSFSGLLHTQALFGTVTSLFNIVDSCFSILNINVVVQHARA
jgi:hypothetical protein